jgi:site-specific DNA recombinase
MKLLCRVEISPERIEINIARHRLAALLAGQSIDLKQTERRHRDSDDFIRLVVPASLKRVGREVRMLVENSDDQTAPDHSLLRVIARAHDIQARLIQNAEIA